MALLEQVSEQLRAGADRFLALPIVLQVVLALGAAIVITYVRLYPWQKATSSIRNLPGPVPKSFLFGSMLESSKAACGSVYDRWQTEAGGPTLRYSELLGGQAVFTADPVAVGHILQHSYTFVKPDFRSLFFSRVTGHGVLVAEGDAHRRQRRVLNPAFTQANIRDMMPIFYRMAYKLDGMIAEWVAEGSESLVPTPVKPEDKIPGTVPMDVNRWLAKLTLDVIALAGFGYEFDSESKWHVAWMD